MRKLCAARCRTFCGKRLCCAGHRFPIFLTRRASRENISGTIERTGAKGKSVIAAKRRFGERLWRGEAAIFVPDANQRHEDSWRSLCPSAWKSKKDNAEAQRAQRNRRQAKGIRVRAVLQRVSRAKVTVDERVTGEIGSGLMILLGVGREDTSAVAVALAEKCANLRIFEDEQGKMNRSLLDVKGGAF